MKKIIILFFVALLLPIHAVKAPTDIYTTDTDPIAYALEIHEFDAEGTDVCFVFDRGKTLLIDRSANRDPALIEAYLAARQVSHLDFVLCVEVPTGGVYPFPFVGTVFVPGTDDNESKIRPALAGESFPLGASRIAFTETTDGLAAEIRYINTRLQYGLQVQDESGSSIETAMVTILKPSPDGIQTEMSAKPLRELLQTDRQNKTTPKA